MPRIKRPTFESRHAFYAAVASGTLSIPETLRGMRSMMNKTQAEYAAMTGVSKESIAKIEQGRMSPTADLLDALGKPFRLRTGFVVGHSVSDRSRRPPPSLGILLSNVPTKD